MADKPVTNVMPMDVEKGATTGVGGSDTATSAGPVAQGRPCDKLNAWMRFTAYDDGMFTQPTCAPKGCCTTSTQLYVSRSLSLAYAVWHTADVWDYTSWRTWSHSFMYLTDWGAAITCAYFALALLTTYFAIRYTDSRLVPMQAGASSKNLPVNPSCCGSNWSVAQRTQLVLFQLVFIMQFVIVCMYWFAIYDWGNDSRSFFRFLNNISVHGIFFVLALVELFMARAQFYARHLVWVVVFSVVYMIVNLISTKDYEPVYEVLKWDGVDTVIILVECYFLMVVGFFLGWGLTVARDRCCCKTRHPGL